MPGDLAGHGFTRLLRNSCLLLPVSRPGVKASGLWIGSWVQLAAWHSCQAGIHIALDHHVKWIYDQQGHLVCVLGDLTMTSIVHIAPSKPMTSIDQSYMNHELCVTSPSPNPHYKKDLESDPVLWEARINITSIEKVNNYMDIIFENLKFMF